MVLRVILGIAIPFFINLSIRKAFPVLYHIPWAALFWGIFVLIGIVFFITRTEIHKLRDKSIIDEIRMDLIISFLVSVAAGVVSSYICKWLDGDDSDN